MPGFEVLFVAGRQFAEGVVEPRPAGNVHVPSGRLVVGDPANGDNAPLMRRVPPGRYPATISVACMGDDHRVAAAMLRFRAGAVSSWEPALLEGRDSDAATPDEYYGYGVDSGLACFADVTAPLPQDVLASASGPLVAASPQCAGVELSIGGVTISVFSANDGTYASFWGLSATGDPVVLVTDFRIIGTEETRGADLLVEHWPGSSLEDEITRNWEARDIVSAPAAATPVAPAARKAKSTTKAAPAKPRVKASAKPKAKATAKPKARATAKPKAKATVKPKATAKMKTARKR